MQAPAPVALAPPAPATFQNARAWALHALCTAVPGEKVRATHALQDAAQHSRAATTPLKRLSPPSTTRLPGRTDRPERIPAMEVPHHSPFTPEGLAGLVHADCHIEFNAIKRELTQTGLISYLRLEQIQLIRIEA